MDVRQLSGPRQAVAGQPAAVIKMTGIRGSEHHQAVKQPPDVVGHRCRDSGDVVYKVWLCPDD